MVLNQNQSFPPKVNAQKHYRYERKRMHAQDTDEAMRNENNRCEMPKVGGFVFKTFEKQTPQYSHQN